MSVMAHLGPASAQTPNVDPRLEGGVLGGQLFSTGGSFEVVEILDNGDTVFTNLIYLDSPAEVLIGDAADTGAAAGPFGPFAQDVELVFRIDVSDTSYLRFVCEGSYFTGPGSRNPDGFEHAIVKMTGPGEAIVGFDDLSYDVPGQPDDHRFRNAVFRIRGDIVLREPDTVGLVDPATGEWHLRDPAGDVTSFFYGNPGDLPIAGDWDGDGDATPGLYRQSDGFFYSRNSNTTGVADAECFAGDPSLSGRR
jgi:hypothetical protein